MYTYCYMTYISFSIKLKRGTLAIIILCTLFGGIAVVVMIYFIIKKSKYTYKVLLWMDTNDQL